MLKTFSNEDWEEYKKYFKSVDALTGRKFVPLIRVLNKCFSDGMDLKTIPAAAMFKKAYGKTYNRQTLFNRQTEVLELTRKFLELCAYKKEPIAARNYYDRELLTRGLVDLYYKDGMKSRDVPEKNIFNEESYKHIQEMVLNKGAYYQMKKNPKEAMNNYFAHSKILLADLLCSLYRTGQELQIQEYYSLNNDYNPVLEFTKSVLGDKFFEKQEKFDDKIFTVPALRYYIFKAFGSPDNEKYIGKALDKFYEEENNFTEYFRTEMYRMFMTYYIVKVNKGERKYYENLYRLYKRKLKNNLVSDLKQCSYPASVFREYIIAGIKVGQYKWAESVIKKYSPLLPANIRGDEINLAEVRIKFYRREFEKALAAIEKYRSRNNMHQIDSLRYKLASYYEMRRYEEAYSEVDRSKHYLKNNKSKIPEIHIAYFKRFLDKLLKLLNYHANPYKKDPELILHEIENDKAYYMMRDWITDKAHELAYKKNKRQV
ncbi:MAG: hypothetical protein PHN88_15180 [Ignavibacteria bacterium]|nr:hypothetical protein [Ignavibacteria bacterium]